MNTGGCNRNHLKQVVQEFLTEYKRLTVKLQVDKNDNVHKLQQNDFHTLDQILHGKKPIQE